MKHFIQIPIVLSIAVLSFVSFSSCSSDDNKTNDISLSEGDQFLQKVLAANVENTINATYRILADSTTLLYNQLVAIKEASIKNNLTQEQINLACNYFYGARANYERSEAFLMGAAADFGIDPHIDTWPLDLAQLHSLLTGSRLVGQLENDGLDEKDSSGEYTYVAGTVAYGDLGQTLLGFHGIEFILFRNGNPRTASELNAASHDSYNSNELDFTKCSGSQELGYALAVCGDLRNNVYRLECSWNEAAPTSHMTILKALEWGHTLTSGESYGMNMKNAGTAGSTYSSVKNAVSSVLSGDGGCANIADEVGNVKLYNPWSGHDASYIESPYSEKSLDDFYHNIQSIENVWKGGVDGHRSAYSFENYFKKYNPNINLSVENAIVNAQNKIKACPTPFVKNYTDGKVKEAIDACNTLKSALEAADEWIQQTNK